MSGPEAPNRAIFTLELYGVASGGCPDAGMQVEADIEADKLPIIIRRLGNRADNGVLSSELVAAAGHEKTPAVN